MDAQACKKFSRIVLVTAPVITNVISVTDTKIIFHSEIAQNDCPGIRSGLPIAQALIKDLLVKGYSLSRIALETGITKASISRLHKGIIRQTNDKTFSKLLGLYCAVYYPRPKKTCRIAAKRLLA